MKFFKLTLENGGDVVIINLDQISYMIYDLNQTLITMSDGKQFSVNGKAEEFLNMKEIK